MLVGHSNRQGVWGSPPTPPKFFWNLIDLISCILVHFGDGHYLFTCFSFRFIAYILTCRAWTSLHCIYRPTSWPFHQPLLFDPLLLFWYWDKSWSLSYSVHFLWVSMSTSNAVRNMGQLLHFVYMLQAERLNEYVTYLLLLSITLLGESNSSTEKGGKCLQLSAR